MTILDDTLPAKVQAVLATYGKSLTFTEAADSGDFDPATGRVTQSSPASYVVTGSPPYGYDQGMVDGNTVLAGDMRVLVEATGAGFTPSTGQKVTIDGEAWRVVRVTTHYSGANKLAYEVQVRR